MAQGILKRIGPKQLGHGPSRTRPAHLQLVQRPLRQRVRKGREAGVTNLWWKYVGAAGKVIGIDRFGLSAPGNVVMQELGITADGVVEAVEGL